MQFEGEEWLYFPAIDPDVAIIRATTADERGNLTFEDEGAYLGAMELALAAHNCGGKVIAQVKRIAQSGTLKPHDVRVPGMLVDFIVEAPEQMQTTATPYDPAISGQVFRPLESFRLAKFDVAKVMARRVAMELQSGWAVNIGFGISANVPRIFIEEGPPRRCDLGDRAGRGRRRAAARFQVRLLVQCRSLRGFAASIRLFSGSRLRCLAAILPADRPRGLGECLQAFRSPRM